MIDGENIDYFKSSFCTTGTGCYDPGFLPVKEIIKLLTEAVADLTQNMYISSGEEVLCRETPDMILNERYTLQDYGVEHGETLYLF